MVTRLCACLSLLIVSKSKC